MRASLCPRHKGPARYYYKARIYSPTLGRFLQTDPIGYEDQYNLYAYVGNDPVNGVDPTGTYSIPLGTYMVENQARQEGNDRLADAMAMQREAEAHGTITGALMLSPLDEAAALGVLASRGFAAWRTYRISKGHQIARRARIDRGINGAEEGRAGPTADALRTERRTGESVGGRKHEQKARNFPRFLKTQRRQTENSYNMQDRHKKPILDDLNARIDDLEDALATPRRSSSETTTGTRIRRNNE